MYKVYFEESFFDGLESFIYSMRKHYYNFYSNTGIYDEEKIINSYFEIYENMKKDILNNINSICEEGIIGRKVTYFFEKVENCSFVFKYGNYRVSFSAIKNDFENKIIVNSLKIEI